MSKTKSAFLPEELGSLCSQLAMALKAGIRVDLGLQAVAQGAGEAKGALLLELAAAAEGGSFGDALEQTGQYPTYMVNMVRIGEASGKLDDVLAALGEHYQRECQLSAQIKRALTYPVALVGLIAVVMLVLVTQVMPVFRDVMQSLGMDSAAMDAGVTIGLAVLAAAVLGLLVALALFLINKGGGDISAVTRLIGPVRRINQKVGAARFASVLSMLLESGMDCATALDMIPGVLEDKEAKAKALACRELLQGGQTVAQALEKTGMFAGLDLGMIHMGERAGALDQAMSGVAQSMSRQAQEVMSWALSLIEPALVGIMSVMIGAMLISVMLPLLNIMTVIG